MKKNLNLDEFVWTEDALVAWAVYYNENNKHSSVFSSYLMNMFKMIYPFVNTEKKTAHEFVKSYRDKEQRQIINTSITPNEWEQNYLPQQCEILSIENELAVFELEQEVGCMADSPASNSTGIIKKFFVSGGIAAVLTLPVPPKKFFANILVKGVRINVPVSQLRKIIKPVTVYPKGIVYFKTQNGIWSALETNFSYNDWVGANLYLSNKIWTVKNSEGEFSVGDKFEGCVGIFIIESFKIQNNELIAQTNRGAVFVSSMRKVPAEKPTVTVYPEGIVAIKCYTGDILTFGKRIFPANCSYQKWCEIQLSKYSDGSVNKIWRVKNSYGEFSVGDNFYIQGEKTMREIISFSIVDNYDRGDYLIATCKEGTVQIEHLRKEPFREVEKKQLGNTVTLNYPETMELVLSVKKSVEDLMDKLKGF